MQNQYAITTLDNPYDPFEEFRLWYMFDCLKGYNTCSYLARIAQFSEGMTTAEECRETERAIDKIIENDFLNIYVKVKRKNTKPN